MLGSSNKQQQQSGNKPYPGEASFYGVVPQLQCYWYLSQRIYLLWGTVLPVHCRVYNSIPDLYPPMPAAPPPQPTCAPPGWHRAFRPPQSLDRWTLGACRSLSYLAPPYFHSHLLAPSNFCPNLPRPAFLSSPWSELAWTSTYIFPP